MVVFDSTFLMLLLNPHIPAPRDRKTNAPVSYAQQRVAGIVDRLTKKHDIVLVPTPVLAEILSYAGDATNEYLEVLRSSRGIRVVPFDERAAIEYAQRFGPGIRSGRKKGAAKGAWQKIKVDQQVVAIALAHGASEIYSNDSDVSGLCVGTGIDVINLDTVPLPKDARQTQMELSDEIPPSPASNSEIPESEE